MEDYLELQTNYYTVYDIACDMVQQLERTIQGDKPSAAVVAELRDKVTTTHDGAERRMDRKGIPHRRSRSLHERRSRSRIVKAESSHQLMSGDLATPPSDPRPADPTPSKPLLQDLVMSKLSAFIMQSPQTRTAALILQAVRQQITVSKCKFYTASTLQVVVEKDFLLLKTRKVSLPATIFLGMESNGLETKEQLARLVNTIASYKAGRDYLLSIGQGKELLAQLQSGIRCKRLHPQTHDNILASIQKLSIRGHVQKELLQTGVLDWLPPALESRLSSYAQEFGTALLMNLCMCQSGHPVLLKYVDAILQAVRLLYKPQICPYLNGCVYGLMAMGRARSRAREMGIEAAIQLKMDRSDCTVDEFQLPFLQRQIRGEVELQRVPLPPAEDEDVGGDNAEGEIEATDGLRATATELGGARLLMVRGKKEVEHKEEINVPGTVLQKQPSTTRMPKKEAKARRAKTVTFDVSRSEPRLATSASQATFVVELSRRRPCVVALGLTEAALQLRQRERERLDAEKAREDEDRRKQAEAVLEAAKKELELKPKQQAKDKKKGDVSQRSKTKSNSTHECKRHSLHHEKPGTSSRTPKSDDSEPRSSSEKSSTFTKLPEPSPPPDESSSETSKERRKPAPIVLPVEEIVPDAAPVSDKIPRRIPEDALAHEYISVFGSRPKVPRTPEKDKKPASTVLLF